MRYLVAPRISARRLRGMAKREHRRIAMPPLVSFVIPVKNDATRLRRCLATVTANDYPRDLIEILVVDNESTDGSGQVGIEAGATVLTSRARSVAELRNDAARQA